ncbi:hypothetical protein GC207_01510 [bacterium]|nr:hypothetical protein [bacterium]
MIEEFAWKPCVMIKNGDRTVTMPGSYTILADARFVYSRAWGVLTDEELLEHAEALRRDPRFEPSFAQLADSREMTDLAVSPPGVRDLALRNPFGKGAKRALVARSPLAFGMARMFELVSHNSADEIKVVRDLAEAKAWLGERAPSNWDELEHLKPDRLFGVSGKNPPGN